MRVRRCLGFSPFSVVHCGFFLTTSPYKHHVIKKKLNQGYSLVLNMTWPKKNLLPHKLRTVCVSLLTAISWVRHYFNWHDIQDFQCTLVLRRKSFKPQHDNVSPNLSNNLYIKEKNVTRQLILIYIFKTHAYQVSMS